MENALENRGHALAQWLLGAAMVPEPLVWLPSSRFLGLHAGLDSIGQMPFLGTVGAPCGLIEDPRRR